MLNGIGVRADAVRQLVQYKARATEQVLDTFE
jgi:hypothetical protein